MKQLKKPYHSPEARLHRVQSDQLMIATSFKPIIPEEGNAKIELIEVNQFPWYIN